VEAKIILVQNILLAREENVIHQGSKPEDPSMVPNPHQHHRKEEEAPHLHIGDNKSKD
jgi:hypothetical protein